MTKEQKLFAVVVASLIGALFFHSFESVLPFLGACTVYALNLWLDRQGSSDLEALKTELKDIKEKVTSLSLQRGLSR